MCRVFGTLGSCSSFPLFVGRGRAHLHPFVRSVSSWYSCSVLLALYSKGRIRYDTRECSEYTYFRVNFRVRDTLLSSTCTSEYCVSFIPHYDGRRSSKRSLHTRLVPLQYTRTLAATSASLCACGSVSLQPRTHERRHGNMGWFGGLWSVCARAMQVSKCKNFVVCSTHCMQLLLCLQLLLYIVQKKWRLQIFYTNNVYL